MRLQMISNLISVQEVKTQGELQQLLYVHGLEVTQATISRDIRTLQLIKVPSKDGTLKYSSKINHDHEYTEKLRHKLRDALIRIDAVNHFTILKTLPGHAHSFGVLLDSLDLEGKVGTVCGNDVCLIICKTPEDSIQIKERMDTLQSNQ